LSFDNCFLAFAIGNCYFCSKYDTMLKVGVLGAGHLGKIHLRLLKESTKYELVGFYDENPEYADKISAELG